MGCTKKTVLLVFACKVLIRRIRFLKTSIGTQVTWQRKRTTNKQIKAVLPTAHAQCEVCVAGFLGPECQRKLLTEVSTLERITDNTRKSRKYWRALLVRELKVTVTAYAPTVEVERILEFLIFRDYLSQSGVNSRPHFINTLLNCSAHCQESLREKKKFYKINNDITNVNCYELT